MALEIEKKYLLNSGNLVNILAEDGLSLYKQKITQFYTSITKEKETRFRKADDTYTMTTKVGKGLVREEKEKKIDQNSFKNELKKRVGNSIKKVRYSFKIHALSASIDVYEKELEGLAVLEVEFPDEKEAKNFTLPNFFKEEIAGEITKNEAYKNKNIALYGVPLANINFEKVFKKIENNPNLEIDTYMPHGASAYNGMRVIFYSLLQKIFFHKREFLQSKESEALHQLRVNIRKTRSLLQCVEDTFDVSIAQRFIDDFKTIANATNTKRDSDVFVEYLEGLDEEEAELILEIFRTHNTESTDDVELMLKGEEFGRVMGEWEFVLQDNEGFFGGKAGALPLKKVAALSLAKRVIKMKKKLTSLHEDTELFYFHKVRIEFKRLRYLSEYFLSLFEDRNIHAMVSTSKKMQTIFGELQDRDVGIDILDSLEHQEKFSENVVIIHATSALEELINDDIYSLRTKILMRKEKLIKTLDNCLSALKIYK